MDITPKIGKHLRAASVTEAIIVKIKLLIRRRNSVEIQNLQSADQKPASSAGALYSAKKQY